METVLSMGLPPGVYKRVSREARKTRIGYRVLDKKNKAIYRFYYNNKNELMADAVDVKGVKSTMEVIDASKVGQSKSYKSILIEKIKNENPEKDDEEIEMMADLLVEGRKTMEELVAKGVNPEVAYRLVRTALDDRITEEDVKNAIEA